MDKQMFRFTGVSNKMLGECICSVELTRLSNNPVFSHRLWGKSYNVNQEVGACSAAEYRPEVHSSRHLQKMLDLGEAVDLVCL